MNDLSVTEAYFLCSVQNKGKLSGIEARKVACLLASILWEMSQAGHLTVEKDRIQLHASDTFAVPWFEVFYQHIKEMETPDLRELLQDYASSFSDRHLNLLSSEIGSSLEQKKLVTRAKIGLFNSRTYFMPHQSAIPGVSAEIQVDMLYLNPLPTNTAVLWALLTQARCIPKDITEEHRQQFSKKWEAAAASASDASLQSAKSILESLFAMLNRLHILMD